MKTCPECGKSFRNLGVHMRKHKREKANAMQGERVQETQPPNTRPKRPMIIGPGGMFIRR